MFVKNLISEPKFFNEFEKKMIMIISSSIVKSKNKLIFLLDRIEREKKDF